MYELAVALRASGPECTYHARVHEKMKGESITKIRQSATDWSDRRAQQAANLHERQRG
jgi:Ser/Thr protein kinase RdoA (MazF antagonist)